MERESEGEMRARMEVGGKNDLSLLQRIPQPRGCQDWCYHLKHQQSLSYFCFDEAQTGWGEGGEGKGRMDDEAGGGMHAAVFRGPQDQEASGVSLSSEKTKFVGTHCVNNTNIYVEKFEMFFYSCPFQGFGLILVGASLAYQGLSQLYFMFLFLQ